MRIWDDPKLEEAHDTRKAARLKRYVRRMKRIHPGWGCGIAISMREAVDWAVRYRYATIVIGGT